MAFNFSPVQFVQSRTNSLKTQSEEWYVEEENPDQEENRIDSSSPEISSDPTPLTGEEARSFYISLFSPAEATAFTSPIENYDTPSESTENIDDDIQFLCDFQSSKSSTSNQNRVEETKRRKLVPIEKLRNKFLRASSNGDLEELKKCLDENPSVVNCMDEFGWSALMCAGFEGNRDIVEYLLRNGVDYTLKNNRNRTALSIARRRGHRAIVNLISMAESGEFMEKKYDEASVDRDESEMESFYCNICSSTFCDPNHETSTMHLLKSGTMENADERPRYLLPESNKGFQMMMKSGWDGKQGLGRDAQGRWYPVKTILKRDRRGLGSTNAPKPRVTHFAAHDVKAVEKSRISNRKVELKWEKLNKKELKKKEEQEREWIRNFRREFY